MVPLYNVEGSIVTQLKNMDMIQRRLDSRQIGDREIYSFSGYITAILGYIDTGWCYQLQAL